MSNQLPQTGFVRLSQILAVIPIGRSSWWSGVKDGRYPPAIKLGRNTTVWQAESIHELIHRISAEAARHKVNESIVISPASTGGDNCGAR